MNPDKEEKTFNPTDARVEDMLKVTSACMALQEAEISAERISKMSVKEFLTICARNDVRIAISSEGTYTL